MLLLRLGLAVVTLGLANNTAFGETGEGRGEPEAGAGEEPSGTPPGGAAEHGTSGAEGDAEEKGAPRKRSRRGRAPRTPKTQGWVAPEAQLRHEPPPRPSGNLHLWRLADGDQVKVNLYNDDGSYSVDALKAANRLLRCKRTNHAKAVDPRLLTVLSHVYDHFGGKRIEVVSGFRDQERTSSYHFKASASDIRVAGVKPTVLRAFVESLDAGGMGIGLYPRSGFVHVDVRPPPSYRWIDWSSGKREAPEKPPVVAKKKRLQS